MSVRQTVAEALHAPEELATLPEGVVASALGLGNPVRGAQLQQARWC